MKRYRNVRLDTGIEELQEENEMEVSEVDFDEMVQDEEIQIMETVLYHSICASYSDSVFLWV